MRLPVASLSTLSVRLRGAYHPPLSPLSSASPSARSIGISSNTWDRLGLTSRAMSSNALPPSRFEGDTSSSSLSFPPLSSSSSSSSSLSSPPHEMPGLENATEGMLFAASEGATHLDGSGPAAALSYALEFLHTSAGLPWWMSIVATTIVFRASLVRFAVSLARNAANMSRVKPILMEYQDKLKSVGNPRSAEALNLGMEYRKFLKDNGVSPFKSFGMVLIQIPAFLIFYRCISRMAEEIPSFANEGALWFSDLSMPDPYYLLPVFSSLTFLATIEVSGDVDYSDPKMKIMKNVFRAMALIIIPATAQMPSGLFCYWVTSNVWTLGQSILLRNPGVRKWLNIPPLVRPNSSIIADDHVGSLLSTRPVRSVNTSTPPIAESTVSEIPSAGATATATSPTTSHPQMNTSTTTLTRSPHANKRIVSSRKKSKR